MSLRPVRAAAVLAAAVLGATPTVVLAQEVRWYDDLEAARTAAAVDGKHVLIDFTGTEWCAWCKRLDEEVLSRPAFVDPVSDHFVFVRLD